MSKRGKLLKLKQKERRAEIESRRAQIISKATESKIIQIESRINKRNLRELEEKNFRVNSDGWEIHKRGSRFFKGLPFGKDYEEYSHNPEGDIVELISTKYKGEQLFTWDAAMRETAKVGKIIPDYQEWELIGDRPDLGIFAGEHYILIYRAVGYMDSLHGQGTFGSYWSRSSISRITAWSQHFRLIKDRRVRQGLFKSEKSEARSVRCFR